MKLMIASAHIPNIFVFQGKFHVQIACLAEKHVELIEVMLTLKLTFSRYNCMHKFSNAVENV